MNIEKKKLKNNLIILTIAMVIFTAYQIQNVFAVFYSESKATTSETLANWNIKINNTDVSSGLKQDFVIDKFNLIGNTSTLENKFAPGMQGDFEINIDATDTDVSVRYDVTFDTTNLERNHMSIVSVEEASQENQLVKTAENTYTGIMKLSDIQNDKSSNSIKIIFNWENDEANNNDDTALGTIVDSKMEIPISVKVTQYMGEEIEEII